MSPRRRTVAKPAPAPDRLSGVRPHRHDDDDDRPSREDRAPQGSQLFKLPVELPRFLRSKRER